MMRNSTFNPLTNWIPAFAGMTTHKIKCHRVVVRIRIFGKLQLPLPALDEAAPEEIADRNAIGLFVTERLVHALELLECVVFPRFVSDRATGRVKHSHDHRLCSTIVKFSTLGLRFTVITSGSINVLTKMLVLFRPILQHTYGPARVCSGLHRPYAQWLKINAIKFHVNWR